MFQGINFGTTRASEREREYRERKEKRERERQSNGAAEKAAEMEKKG